jgi:ATP-dependent DNA ligase
VERRGKGFFRLACDHDLEGIVAKLADGRYHVDGTRTSWVKIKNLRYTQATGRHELFERRDEGRRAQTRRVLAI